MTDDNGFYRVLNLPSGLYTFSAKLDGFATAEQKDVRMLLGSTPTVNFNLQPATVAETITVTAEVPVVEVTNTAASTLIQVEQVKGLPLAQRDFKNLVVLTPQTRFDSERGNLSISGQRGINTNVTVDGVDFNNAFFGGTVGGAEGPRAAVDLPGVGQGDLGHHQRRLGRVRPLGRRLRQRHHQERHQQPVGLALLLQPAAVD